MFGCCIKEKKSAPEKEHFDSNHLHTQTTKYLPASNKGSGSREKQPVIRNLEISTSMAVNLESLVARLEAAVVKLEAHGASSAHSTLQPGEEVHPYVTAYDDIINGPLAQFLALSQQIGQDVQNIAALVSKAFKAQRDFLSISSKARSPPQDALVKLLQPTSEAISAVQASREGNRKSPMFNHLSVLSESVPALGWVAVSPTPAPFVKELLDAGQFYSNRVLKEYKEKDPSHLEWVKSWNEVMSKLQAYVKEYHTTGVLWNMKGVEALSLLGGAPAGSTPPPPPPPGGAPPPPPPPPPVEAVTGGGGAAGAGDEIKAALFADLNKGTDITKGLKKVTDDMKTHKNPKLRQGPAPFKARPEISPKPGRANTQKTVAVAKPAKCELEGKRWIVEFQRDNKNLVISDTELKHTVYIYKCENSVIQIKGKVNSIVMDGCKKSAVVFDDLVSSMEFVNCQSVQGQVNGKVSIVSIDKTDGCMMYLSQQSANAEIVTAKSSEMNVLIPDSTGEYKEYPVPEQYKTVFNNGKLVTTVSDSI